MASTFRTRAIYLGQAASPSFVRGESPAVRRVVQPAESVAHRLIWRGGRWMALRAPQPVASADATTGVAPQVPSTALARFFSLLAGEPFRALEKPNLSQPESA